MGSARTAELTLASRASAYITLTKPDVSLLVLMTTAAGYYMGARGPVNWLNLLNTVFGTMLIAAGTAALNHYMERDVDRHMRRTAARPLPSGILQPREALAFGLLLAFGGAAYLWMAAGWLAALLGAATCLSYLLAYTPLKRKTIWATFVGAFPGAVPPMIGWVAAAGMRQRRSPKWSCASAACTRADSSCRSPLPAAPRAIPPPSTSTRRRQTPAADRKPEPRAAAGCRSAEGARPSDACAGPRRAPCSDSAPPCRPRSTSCQTPYSAGSANSPDRARTCNSPRRWSSAPAGRRPAW